ncbi:MAG: hypothetical protein GY913_07160, partial [Proteobacteria bacterium]|nr:hypothetical protein [Pseudomonadota bacterium]
MDRTLFDIWPEVIAGPALLTTFTFNAPFFEMRVLPVLQKRRAHPIVVFVDNEGYEAALHVVALLDGAGRDYQLVPVRLGRCFHPKVHYFPAAGAAVV